MSAVGIEVGLAGPFGEDEPPAKDDEIAETADESELNANWCLVWDDGKRDVTRNE